MASRKCVGPAHPSEDDGEARRDLLGSSSSNNPSLDQLQAPSLLADTAGEDDLAYFRARPGISSRKRLAFENEPPPGALECDDSVAFISVRVKRDATGKPATILRAAIKGEWGRA
jgi:hypothetical protein